MSIVKNKKLIINRKENSYRLTDPMSFLYKKYFDEHNKDMMMRTHGYFADWCQFIPLSYAIILMKHGIWEKRKKDLFVCLP